MPEDDEVMEFRNSLDPIKHIRMACLELAVATLDPKATTSDIIAAARRFEDFIERGY